MFKNILLRNRLILFTFKILPAPKFRKNRSTSKWRPSCRGWRPAKAEVVAARRDTVPREEFEAQHEGVDMETLSLGVTTGLFEPPWRLNKGVSI